jgi:hypothetical protein
LLKSAVTATVFRTLQLFEFNRRRQKARIVLAPAVLHERISNLLSITRAYTLQQKEALFKALHTYPELLQLRPATLNTKAAQLLQQLEQLGVAPHLVQQLISRNPLVLKSHSAEVLLQKLVQIEQLLALQPAEVLSLCSQRQDAGRCFFSYNAEQLGSKLRQFIDILQPYMPPSDVRQMVLAQPALLVARSTSVRARVDVVVECLPHWTPQQLGAALLVYPVVLQLSPITLRYKWGMMRAYRQLLQQEHRQQQQHQGYHVPEMGLFLSTRERYGMLEYNLEQQQLQQQACRDNRGQSSSLGSSSSSSSSGGGSGVAAEGNDAGVLSLHIPTLSMVLQAPKPYFSRLVAQHYPGFPAWYQQRQAREKQQAAQQD